MMGMTDAIVPTNTRVLDNGAVFDTERRVIIKGASMDKAQASALANIRWDRARAAWAQGMSDVSKSPMSAIRDIAKAQTSLAMDDSKGRASTEAAKLVLKVGQYVPDDTNTGNSPTSNPFAGDNAGKVLDILASLVDAALGKSGSGWDNDK